MVFAARLHFRRDHLIFNPADMNFHRPTDTELARLIYDALSSVDEDAYIGPFEDERVVIDGRFDLFKVARYLLAHMK